jgi:hypothetical protein
MTTAVEAERIATRLRRSADIAERGAWNAGDEAARTLRAFARAWRIAAAAIEDGEWVDRDEEIEPLGWHRTECGCEWREEIRWRYWPDCKNPHHWLRAG